MTGTDEDHDLYFDMSGIISSKNNPSYWYMEDDIRHTIDVVVSALRDCPKFPMKIGQGRYTMGGNKVEYSYMVKNLQREVSRLIINWAKKTNSAGDIYDTAFLKKIEGNYKRRKSDSRDTLDGAAVEITMSSDIVSSLISGENGDTELYTAAASTILDIVKNENLRTEDNDPELRVISEALVDDNTRTSMQRLLNSNEGDRYLYNGTIEFTQSDAHTISSVSGEGGDERTGARHCARCNFTLSEFSGMYDEVVLTTMGFPRSSKSTTIASNIYFMDEVLGLDVVFDTTIKNLGNEKDASGTKVLSWAEFDKRYYQHFKNGCAVEATNAQEDQIPRFSILIKLPYINESFVLTIIDIPGEFVAGQNGEWSKISSIYSEIYKATNYLWYCTEILEVKKGLNNDNADRNEMEIRHELSKHQGRFQVENGKKVPNDRVPMEQILSLWENNLSPVSLLAQNGNGNDSSKKVKVMMILGKTDFCENETFVKAFPTFNGETYSLFADGGFDAINSEKLYGRNDRFVWVDEQKMFEYMNKWRRFFCDEAFERVVSKLDQKFGYSGGYCAMSAYGFQPINYPDIDANEYSKAQMEYFTYRDNAQESGELVKGEMEFLKEKGFTEYQIESITEVNNTMKTPESYMGGWPILWVMICEGKVRLKNDIYVTTKKLFKKPETSKETRYSRVTSNKNSESNMLMMHGVNREGVIEDPMYKKHTIDEIWEV